MEPSSLIITQADGTQIDHIGLACRNLDEGVRYFRERTGIDPKVIKPSPGAAYQSAAVRIGDATFFEILGPNPEHKGIHPLKSLLKRISEPKLWFWYVSTNDFDAAEQAVKDAGRSIERKTEVERDGEQEEAEKQGYVGASIGPGFWQVYPSVIQWKGGLKENILEDDKIIPIKEFSVITGSDLEAAKVFYKKVGINEAYLKASADEKSYLSLTLETPKGPITFKDEMESITTWTVLATLMKDVFCLL